MVADREKAMEVLGLFDVEGRDSSVPVIDELGQQAVREYFEEEGLIMVGGHSGNANLPRIPSLPEPTVNMLLKPDLEKIMRRFPDAIVGPYIFAGKYLPTGVGVWHAPIKSGMPQDHPRRNVG